MFKRRTQVLWLGVLLSLGTSLATAETKIQYQVGQFSSPLIQNPTGWVTDSSSITVQGVTANATVAGLAQIGVLKAATSVNSGGDASWTGMMNTQWRDTLNFQGGAVGERGYITFGIEYDWNLGLSGYSGVADVHVVAQASGSYAIVRETHMNCPPLSCSDTITKTLQVVHDSVEVLNTVPSPHRAFVTLPITFGVDIPLMVDLTAQVQVAGISNPNRGAAGWVDAANSVYWGGIVNVTDQFGDSVAFSVTSHSGADYTKSFASPVPEPQTALLMLAGLAATFIARRRRQ